MMRLRVGEQAKGSEQEKQMEKIVEKQSLDSFVEILGSLPGTDRLLPAGTQFPLRRNGCPRPNRLPLQRPCVESAQLALCLGLADDDHCVGSFMRHLAALLPPHHRPIRQFGSLINSDGRSQGLRHQLLQILHRFKAELPPPSSIFFQGDDLRFALQVAAPKFQFPTAPDLLTRRHLPMGISALGTAEGEDREGEEIDIGTHGGVDGCVFEEGLEVALVDRDALEDGGSSCLLDVVANLLEFVHRRLLLVSLMIIILKVF